MKPSTPFRGWLAVLVAPLVIAGWFLWPLIPFNHALGDVIRSVATVYVFFFLTRGLAFLATAALSSSRAAVHYAFVFLSLFLISYSISWAERGRDREKPRAVALCWTRSGARSRP